MLRIYPFSLTRGVVSAIVLPMLKLRLQRVGRKNDPSFRVVVTEHQNGPQSGKFLEILGSYDARQGKPQLKGDRIKHWLEKGAQASPTVNNMLVKLGVIEGKTVNNLPKMKPVEAKPEVAEVPKAEALAKEANPPAGGEPAPAPASEEPKPEAPEATPESAPTEEVPVAETPVEEVVAPAAEPVSDMPAKAPAQAETPAEPTQ